MKAQKKRLLRIAEMALQWAGCALFASLIINPALIQPLWPLVLAFSVAGSVLGVNLWRYDMESGLWNSRRRWREEPIRSALRITPVIIVLLIALFKVLQRGPR
jgi:hypothetical protein